MNSFFFKALFTVYFGSCKKGRHVPQMQDNHKILNRRLLFLSFPFHGARYMCVCVCVCVCVCLLGDKNSFVPTDKIETGCPVFILEILRNEEDLYLKCKISTNIKLNILFIVLSVINK